MEWKDPQKDGKIAGRLQNKISERIGEENRNLSRAEGKLAKVSKEISEKGISKKLERQLNNANADVANTKETIGALQQTSMNLDFMGSSETDQLFTFNETEGEEGHTYMQDGVITMDVVGDANAVHESTHAMQMVRGDMVGHGGVDNNTFRGGPEGLYKGEIEAYKNQFAYDPTKVQGLPSYLGPANTIGDINKAWVIGIQNKYGEYIYGKIVLGNNYNKRGLESWLRSQ
jgi:hypothetical protein